MCSFSGAAQVDSIGAADSAYAGFVPVLQSSCEETGADYALFWSFVGGRLCVAAAWAKSGRAKAFTSKSCQLMLAPCEGVVGRVFNRQRHEYNEDVRSLCADDFVRLNVAKVHNIKSVLIVPWENRGVWEFGALESWHKPLPLIQKIMSGASPLVGMPLSVPPAAEWAAVLWKRSRFLGRWRLRLLRLAKVGNGWEFSSWDALNGQITGCWNLELSLPYVQIGPAQGFSAYMELSDDLAIAADSTAGADAMEGLATILNGSLVRHAHGRTLCDLNQRSPSGNPQEAHMNISEWQSCVLKMERRLCDTCCEEEAKGRLVVQPVNDDEIGRWLCKSCFAAAWLPACQGVTDGRLRAHPQWFSLTSDGVLIDSTPPRTQRYSRVR